MTVTVEEIVSQFRKYLVLSDSDVVDVVLGTVVANRMPGDSISLYLVGPSSSAKTEVIRSLMNYPYSYHLTKVTPHTLISGYQDKNRHGENMSLLLKLEKQGKNILVFKDFTTVLAMRPEDRAELTSHFREMADGYICGDFGNDQRLELKYNFGVIAGVTNAVDEFSSVEGQLGERFLKFRVNAELADEIAQIAMDKSPEKEALRTEVGRMVCEFLSRFDMIFELPTWDPEYVKKFINLCVLCSHVRTPIIKDRKGVQMSQVQHEGPGRLVSSADKLAKSIAIIRGQSTIGSDIYRIMKKTVRDTMPPYRILVAHELYEKGILTTGEIAHHLRIHWKTAAKHCEDLRSVDVISHLNVDERKLAGYSCPEDSWQIKDEYRNRMDLSEIFVIDRV